MSELTFSCPKCKQSLEGDDSMRGLVIECPSCKTPITVPASPRKHVTLTKALPGGTMRAYVQPPSAAGSKFGTIVGFVIGLIIGLVIGYITGKTFETP